MHAPVITLTTDFGTSDHYVAQMKAVLLARVPGVRLVDVTHEVPRHSVLHGSFTLERVVASFPAGTVHVAVVDPGVGSARRILVAEVRAQVVICPDNGLITWAWHTHPGVRCGELSWRPALSSQTFHGRDVMAPVAAMLATGVGVEEVSRPIEDPVLLPVAPATGTRGRVIHVDHFGNCTTNIPARLVPAGARGVRVGGAGGVEVGMRRTYSEVGVGEAVALVGSSELVEVAVNMGSAASKLGIGEGAEVEVV